MALFFHNTIFVEEPNLVSDKLFLMKQFLIASFTLLIYHLAFGQWENIKFEDTVYNESIHSVKFHLTDFPLTQPIIDLESAATLALTFDDLDREIKDFYYTIIHCNADWRPSDLSTMEYIDGFDEDLLRAADFSFNTLTEFTNYRLTLPNENMAWTKSGNYILLVYETDGDKIPLITRRFVVVEPLVRIIPEMVRPTNIQKAKTHQEFDFKVAFEKIKVRNPKQELKSTILQNGRWDNAISNLPPYFIYNGEVIYDYQDKIVFPAGKEFRYVDLRSFRYRNDGVADIKEFRNVYEVTLYQDPLRAFTTYQFFTDINGNYTVENVHEEDNDLESDYAQVLFSLEKNKPFENANVYLFGKISDWKIQERFKLAYSDKLQLYAADILLKQGFYNYGYAFVPKGTTTVDLSEIEGDWFETENEYTILTYYRPFGGRYDRLVGAITFRSNE